MNIVHVTADNAKAWAVLCNELWPHNDAEEMLHGFYRGEYKNEYMAQINESYIAFISLSLRTDYVEGKEGAHPVGYLEGLYVKPLYRNRGIASELVCFAKAWAIEQNCTTLASDCALSNAASRSFHNQIGFSEAGTNVHFIMKLNREATGSASILT